MIASCLQCKANFEITTEDLQFYDTVSPIINGEKFPIPPPKLCPSCRNQRRLAFRNERKLYQRTSSLSGKSIISAYAPQDPYKVYDQAEWWSDVWDGTDYGRDFDFSKTMNEQLRELYRDVPHASLYTTNAENSYYTNYTLNQKNCYLIFGAGNNEDCLYGKFVVQCKDVVDSLTLYSSELCYQGIASERCYDCKFFLNCRGCTNSIMIEDCSACQDCIGCYGLRSKQYCVFNKQYSREEYEQIKKEYEYLTPEKIAFLREKLEELKKNLPRLQSHIYASENCTGESVYNSKNCQNAFDAKDCEDCKYISFAPKSLVAHDIAFCAPDGVRFCYNVCAAVDLERCMSCFFTWYGSDMYYCMDCHHGKNLFACVGLKSKQYCILNKQYTKEEYEKLVPKIIEHMQKTGEFGEYFEFQTSAFPYNETVAQEYFPLTREQAEKMNLRWREEKEEVLNEETSTPPADIREVDDSILKKILVCEVSGKKYKIIPQELEFYRKMKLPIPRRHPDQRHMDRLQYHNFQTVFDAICTKCNQAIKTMYPPEKQQNLTCEACYMKEVY